VFKSRERGLEKKDASRAFSDPDLEAARLKKQAADKERVARTRSQDSEVKNRNRSRTEQWKEDWRVAQLKDGFADVLTEHIEAVSSKVSGGLVTDSAGLKEACTCTWGALVKMAIAQRIQFTPTPGAKLPSKESLIVAGWPKHPAGALAAWKFQLGT
jgi:hypothetical protein